MRQRTVRNRNRGRITGKAAFLAAGLMLASCNASTGTKPAGATYQDKVHHDIASLKLKKDTKTKIVREGDVLVAFEYPDSSGFLGLRINHIGKTRVLMAITTEVLMSEHETTLWGVDYGEEKSIGESVLNLSVKAERGQEPRTAQLTVTTTALSE